MLTAADPLTPSAAALIVANPNACAVARPADVTETAFELLDDQATVLSVSVRPARSFTVAAS